MRSVDLLPLYPFLSLLLLRLLFVQLLDLQVRLAIFLHMVLELCGKEFMVAGNEVGQPEHDLVDSGAGKGFTLVLLPDCEDLLVFDVA